MQSPATQTSRVYVANCTLQNQTFEYCKTKGGARRSIQIKIGAQAALPEELTNGEIAYIEQIHRPYGLLRIDEVRNPKEFVGTVLSVGTPVPLGVLGKLHESNREHLIQRGAELRKAAAVAAAQSISGQNPEFQTDPNVKLEALEVEIKEEEKAGRDTELNETTRVTNDLSEAESGNQGKRRKR